MNAFNVAASVRGFTPAIVRQNTRKKEKAPASVSWRGPDRESANPSGLTVDLS
jgi:hypothetical protein